MLRKVVSVDDSTNLVRMRADTKWVCRVGYAVHLCVAI